MDENNQQQATDTSQTQEQIDDWSGAEAEFLADKGVETEKKKDETDANKSDDTDQSANNGTDDDASKGGDQDEAAKSATDGEKSDPNEDENLEQPDDRNAAYREARQVQKELEADRTAMVTDVKKELYPDWSDDITDADGDPIRTPRDVMARTNPETGKPFTEEEATAWLFAAQKHKDGQRTEMESRVQQVAEVMIDQRDQADQVKEKYGGLLAKLPELRKEIFADYKATLVVDKETGLILDAPISMYKFFERALRPYEQYVKQIQTESAAKQNTQTEAQRKQTHQDREDIHSASGGSVTDPEEASWAKAAKEYYES